METTRIRAKQKVQINWLELHNSSSATTLEENFEKKNVRKNSESLFPFPEKMKFLTGNGSYINLLSRNIYIFSKN